MIIEKRSELSTMLMTSRWFTSAALYILLTLPQAFASAELKTELKSEIAESIWDAANVGEEIALQAESFLVGVRGNVSAGLIDPFLFRIIEFNYRQRIDLAGVSGKEHFIQRVSALDEESQFALLTFLSSPLGKKYREPFVSDLSVNEKQMDMARRLPRLMNNQKHVEALAIMLEDHYFPVLEGQWGFMQRSVVFGIMAASLYENGGEASETAVDQALDALSENQAVALTQMNQMMLVNSVYDYRDVSVEEVKRLDEFLGTPAGAVFLEASNEAFALGITAILEGLLVQLIDSVEQETTQEFQNDIRNNNSDKCLDLPWAKPFDGLSLVQYECNRSAGQSLKLVDAKLVSTVTGKCFSVMGDNWSSREKLFLVQSSCEHEDVAQFEALEAKKFQGAFQLREKNLLKCITITGKRDEDAVPVELKNCRSKKNQVFSLNSNVL